MTDNDDYGAPSVLVLVDRIQSRSVPGQMTWIALVTNTKGEVECKRYADSLMQYWCSLGEEIGGKVILLSK